jgi:leucine dehydrogenase
VAGSPPPSSPLELLSGEFEEVHHLHDRASGLKAIVALHDTSAGPALGGVRCARYASEGEALDEALRLARAMTLKVLLAELPAGGGKAVVLDHDELDRPAAFEALGRFIEELGGRFFTSSDFGTGERDVRALARGTRFVATPQHGVADDLAARTAEGVFLAAGTALDVLGIAEWKGQRIAIQGLGAIGSQLAMIARRAGARVIASDVDAECSGRASDTGAITLVDPDRIWDVDCDVFAPCAGSGVLDETTIPRLKCRIVCGAANEQLRSPECGDLLLQRNVLYAPDFLVNAGAVIRGCGPALPGFEPPRDLSGIGSRLRDVLIESIESKVAPHRVALQRAERRLEDARARRRGVAASAS